MIPQTDFEQVNRRWLISYSPNTWVWLWKKLWRRKIFHQDKIVIWRLLDHGFFTHRHAEVWGFNFGLCPCCSNVVETINHLFHGCTNICCSWDTLGMHLVGTGWRISSCRIPYGKSSREVSCILTITPYPSFWLLRCLIVSRGREKTSVIRELVVRSLLGGSSLPLSLMWRPSCKPTAMRKRDGSGGKIWNF